MKHDYLPVLQKPLRLGAWATWALVASLALMFAAGLCAQSGARSAGGAAAQSGLGSWLGFDTHKIALPSGAIATLVVPRNAAPGSPWILQWALYGDAPATVQMNAPAAALLEKGWHVAALPLGDTYGAPAALQKWDELYSEVTTTYGLAHKTILVGLSREGLAIHRWAALHPEQVCGIYADRASCDFKSLLRVTKSRGLDVEKWVRSYGFGSEAEALAYRENPIDLAGKLAAARIPLLHVVGEKGDIVPPSENALVLQSRVKAAGGTMEIITVPEAGRHPHGLADPQPVIDFMLRAFETSVIDEKFLHWKAGLSAAQQAWETVLEQNLGSYYLPGYKRQKVAGTPNAFDYVPDEPGLPRVLLIGDSVSGGYTRPTQAALAGRANVHRAPENCGPTANGVKKLDIWLGEGRWEVIHLNFGLHDSKTPVADYEARLRQIVIRLKKTGAKLIWASTTPRPADAKEGPVFVAAVVERNEVAARVMNENSITINDLFEFITPHATQVQNPKDVHFNAEGYRLLGEAVAKAITGQLPKR